MIDKFDIELFERFLKQAKTRGTDGIKVVVSRDSSQTWIVKVFGEFVRLERRSKMRRHRRNTTLGENVDSLIAKYKTKLEELEEESDAGWSDPDMTTLVLKLDEFTRGIKDLLAEYEF